MQTAQRLPMDFVIRECDREVAEVLDAFLNALVSEFNALQAFGRGVLLFGHFSLPRLSTGTGQKRFFVLKRHHFHEPRPGVAPMCEQFSR